MFDYIKENGVYLFVTPDGLHIIGTLLAIKDQNFWIVNRPFVILNPAEEFFPTQQLPDGITEIDFEPLGSILADQKNHILNMNSILSICTPSIDLFDAYCGIVEAEDSADTVTLH